MGFFSDLMGGGVKDAVGQNTALFQQTQKKAFKDLDSGLTRSTGAIDTGMGTLKGLGEKYGAATDLYLDALGVNGADGTGRAQGAFTAGPGYQWMVDQAMDAVNRGAGARGMLRSGNTMADTVTRASGLAGQEYNNWLANLAKGIAPETGAAGGQADLSKTLAGLYQNDANTRAGLRTNIAGGIANQTNMGAQADMSGASNIANLGLNTLKMLAGMGGYGGFGGGAA